jgi:hypothetical protein
MDKDKDAAGANSKSKAICSTKQVIIYEILNKAQNLMTNNSEALLSSKSSINSHLIGLFKTSLFLTAFTFKSLFILQKTWKK